jgi:hypothetical protein
MRRNNPELLCATLMVAVTMLLCGCNGDSEDSADGMLDARDPDVRKILAAHKTNGGDLNLSNMRIIPEDSSYFPQLKSPSIKLYHVPPPKDIFDAFQYCIVLDKRGRRFWIHQTGGFAGVNEMYGVGILQSNGNIEYVEQGN